MRKLRACQCGGVPVYKPGAAKVKGRTGRPRTPKGSERLECPACGNRTAERCGREALAEEWNSAGWCGQTEEPQAYVPYGPEWTREMMRWPKAELVKLTAYIGKEKAALQETVRRLQAQLNRTELEEVVLRLRQCGTLRARPEAGGLKTEVGGRRQHRPSRGQKGGEG